MSNANANQQKNDRKPFVIDIDEHVPFAGTATTMFVSSNELCKAVSDLFHSVFADFEGCIFEIPQNNSQLPPYISLIFNHGEYDEDATVACERINGGKNNQSDVLARIRYRDAQLSDGDRFILNEDGKDAVKPLLLPRVYNNGNFSWKNVAADYSEGNQGFYGYPGPQYTKVSFIDLDKICSLLFGHKFGEDNVDYHVQIFAPMSTPAMGQPVSNYMLSVIRVSEKEIIATREKLGLATMSRIVR